MEESEFQVDRRKSFSATESWVCSFRPLGADALLREKHRFPLLYFHERVPGGAPDFTDPSCVLCIFLVRSVRDQGTSKQPMQTIELNVLSSSINSLFFLLRKRRKIKCFGKGQGDSCFFSPEVRKGMVESCSGCAAGDDPSHIYGHPFYLCLYVFPEGMSIGGHKSLPSLVTRLMVNGSTGNPFKTSRRKVRHQIDRHPPRKLFAYQLFSDEKLAHRIYAGSEVVCEMDLLDYECILEGDAFLLDWPISIFHACIYASTFLYAIIIH